MSSNSDSSYHFVRLFDGSGEGRGYDDWRAMLYAEPLAKGREHISDGLLPAVPEPTESSAVEVRLKKGLQQAYLAGAKRMV